MSFGFICSLYCPYSSASMPSKGIGWASTIRKLSPFTPRSKTLQVPTLIVWGLKDFFFDKKWAYWLKETMPGEKRVVEVEDARLFFPEDRPDALAVPVLEFWNELSKTCVDGRRHAQQTSTYDEILRISRRRVGKACRG
jgi:hypothetical protein